LAGTCQTPQPGGRGGVRRMSSSSSSSSSGSVNASHV
jgi:hypothetical protein